MTTEKVYVPEGESSRRVRSQLPEPPSGFEWVHETSRGEPDFKTGTWPMRERFALRPTLPTEGEPERG